MNRTIKFRAISKSTGLFVYGYLASNSKIYDPKTGITHDIISKTISQSTGLFDKNGTEIYEGDVISYEDEAKSDYDGEVEIFRNTGQVFWEDSVCAYFVSNRVSIDMEDLWADPNIEVLGNIFENENLLKQPYANQR